MDLLLVDGEVVVGEEGGAGGAAGRAAEVAEGVELVLVLEHEDLAVEDGVADAAAARVLEGLQEGGVLVV